MGIQLMLVVCWLITLLFLNWAGKARADHRQNQSALQPTDQATYRQLTRYAKVMVWLTRLLFIGAICGTFMQPKLGVICLTLTWVTSYATVYFLRTADRMR